VPHFEQPGSGVDDVTTTTCGVLDLTAMARATTQPITVHPRKMLMTSTEPTFVTFRENAMITGRKYNAIMMMKPKAPKPLDVAAAEAIMRVLS
jgi:hypothetical protein